MTTFVASDNSGFAASPNKALTKAVLQESPQSLRDLGKGRYARDQSECRDTFKAIRSASTEEQKNDILDQALTYFMAKAEQEKEAFHNKLESASNSAEELKGLETEKAIRAAERKRWTLKTQGVNSAEFVSFSEHYVDFKSEVARSIANISYPFTADELTAASYWKDQTEITASDPNLDAFDCQQAILVEEKSAQEVEEMFSETTMKVNPATLREATHADQAVCDVTVGDEGAWAMGPSAEALTAAELAFNETFWTPQEKSALDTQLDEERVVNGLSAWRSFTRSDIIDTDSTTKKQDALVAARAARGPLSNGAINKRIARMARYFSKRAEKNITVPASTFFSGCVKSFTKADVVDANARYQAAENAFSDKWAALGAPFCVSKEVFAVQKSFSFASPKAKAIKDAHMSKRAAERAGERK